MFEQHAQMKKKVFFDESKEPAKNLALQSRFKSFNPQILLIIINSWGIGPAAYLLGWTLVSGGLVIYEGGAIRSQQLLMA